ncbi:hypothetical protein N7456_005159 [Penicillium angulare]|uniref:Uncharacterized protein n=1 Tax=Penicillium angulare TaxID=116970 RepID=A0A9W9FY14_9EURO|nr:hypothetical protein N7456_005159 [Penicillium angulare]
MALLLTGLSLLAATQAAKLTSVPVPNGCAGLPNWGATGRIAGPWIPVVDQCVNTTATDHACTMEGYGTQAVAFQQQQGNNVVEKGYIGIVEENTMAKSTFRCLDGTGFQAVVPHSGYTSVAITDMPYSAQLMWNLGEYSEPVYAYYHYLDGKKQDGVFLGSHNVTTWGISLQDGEIGSGDKPWWMIRLLGPNSQDPQTGHALEDGEYRTFIRIDGINV